MAFTRAPAQDTYQTKPVPLMAEWEARTGANVKTTAATNIVYDIIKNDATGEQYVQAIKRDGTEVTLTVPGSTQVIMGIYYWSHQSSDYLIVVTSQNIYMYSAIVSPWTTPFATVASPGFNAGVLEVGFTEFLYENGDVHLIIADGTIFGTLTITGTWTVCTDADRPFAFLAYPVFLDGYLFLADRSGKIYNSDLNTPLTWSASTFITAEAYPDLLGAIARSGPYIVALGESSVEWFYDAGNPTGTPLAPVSGAAQSVGMVTGVAVVKNIVYFIGKSANGMPSLWTIEGTKLNEHPSNTLTRWMSTTIPATFYKGHILSFQGGLYYTVSSNKVVADVETYYYDIRNKLWCKLSLGGAASTSFLVGSTITNRLEDNDYSYNSYFVLNNSRTVLRIKPGIYQDSGTNFTCTFRSRPMDYGTQRIKFASRLVLNCDSTSSSSNMGVSWSDDDENTFSTARNVDLSNQYKQLYALGSFRRRTWEFTYTDNFPMRWEAAELDYNQGQS